VAHGRDEIGHDPNRKGSGSVDHNFPQESTDPAFTETQRRDYPEQTIGDR